MAARIPADLIGPSATPIDTFVGHAAGCRCAERTVRARARHGAASRLVSVAGPEDLAREAYPPGDFDYDPKDPIGAGYGVRAAPCLVKAWRAAGVAS